jgi:hypothetical protein
MRQKTGFAEADVLRRRTPDRHARGGEFVFTDRGGRMTAAVALRRVVDPPEWATFRGG